MKLLLIGSMLFLVGCETPFATCAPNVAYGYSKYTEFEGSQHTRIEMSCFAKPLIKWGK